MVQAYLPSDNKDFGSVLSLAKSGHEPSWERIYLELIGPITGYLASRGASDPDDLASETFLQVARGIHGFDGDEDSFRSWVFVIAHRRLLDARRREGRRPRTSHAPEPADLVLAGGDVELEAMHTLEAHWVQNMLESLTDSQQEVLALRVVADLSLEETARVMGKRVGAVKALQRRALNEVRRRLDDGRVTI